MGFFVWTSNRQHHPFEKPNWLRYFAVVYTAQADDQILAYKIAKLESLKGSACGLIKHVGCCMVTLHSPMTTGLVFFNAWCMCTHATINADITADVSPVQLPTHSLFHCRCLCTPKYPSHGNAPDWFSGNY